MNFVCCVRECFLFACLFVHFRERVLVRCFFILFRERVLVRCFFILFRERSLFVCVVLCVVRGMRRRHARPHTLRVCGAGARLRRVHPAAGPRALVKTADIALCLFSEWVL